MAEHNRNPKPFIWTAKACDILAKVQQARSVLPLFFPWPTWTDGDGLNTSGQ